MMNFVLSVPPLSKYWVCSSSIYFFLDNYLYTLYNQFREIYTLQGCIRVSLTEVTELFVPPLVSMF
jgi:hypothetical protein